MAKPKKSIADLIGSKPKKRPTIDEIDNITKKIHQSAAPATAPAEKKTAPIKKKEKAVVKEKIKRISVNASVSLYLKAKTKATMEDKTLMAYIIGLMEKDLL